MDCELMTTIRPLLAREKTIQKMIVNFRITTFNSSQKFSNFSKIPNFILPKNITLRHSSFSKIQKKKPDLYYWLFL